MMPRYKELMDGYVYPIGNLQSFMIIVLVAANTFWVAYKFMQELRSNKGKVRATIRSFINKYFIEFCLLLLSIFAFRSALGRAEFGHIAYSSPLVFLLSIYIVIKHYLWKFLEAPKMKVFKSMFTIALIVIFVTISGVQIYRIADQHLLADNFPLNVKDSQFIPDNYKATISFLKEDLEEDEEFVTMTNEGVWYYFLDKPCPTRFPVVWFAMPYFYQEEFVDDLEKKDVKYILYKNDNAANKIDGIDNEVRLPIIFDYIRNNYEFLIKIDDNEIWVKQDSRDSTRESQRENLPVLFD